MQNIGLLIITLIVSVTSDIPSNVQFQQFELSFNDEVKSRNLISVEIISNKEVIQPLNVNTFSSTKADAILIDASNQTFGFKESWQFRIIYMCNKTTPALYSNLDESSTSTTDSTESSTQPTSNFSTTPPPLESCVTTVEFFVNVTKSIKFEDSPAVLTSQTQAAFNNTQIGNVNITTTYGLIVKKIEQVNKNTAAVVLAVIESLIIGAIVFVFIYKFCQKMKYGGSTSTYPDNSFDAAFSPRLDYNNPRYSEGSVTRNTNYPITHQTGYGYDQPPLEMTNRMQNNTMTTRGRVEAQTPSLVPVPLNSTPSIDPLRAWET